MLEREFTPKSSLKQQESTIKRFKVFLESKQLSSDILNIPSKVLNDYLRYFYSQLRNREGNFYAPASLICFRAAIHRYYVANKPEINIMNDQMFHKSNCMLRTMVAKYKRSGQENRKGYTVIDKCDMIILRQYFDRTTPEKLQEEIIFNLILVLEAEKLFHS